MSRERSLISAGPYFWRGVRIRDFLIRGRQQMNNPVPYVVGFFALLGMGVLLVSVDDSPTAPIDNVEHHGTASPLAVDLAAVTRADVDDRTVVEEVDAPAPARQDDGYPATVASIEQVDHVLGSQHLFATDEDLDLARRSMSAENFWTALRVEHEFPRWCQERAEAHRKSSPHDHDNWLMLVWPNILADRARTTADALSTLGVPPHVVSDFQTRVQETF